MLLQWPVHQDIIQIMELALVQSVLLESSVLLMQLLKPAVQVEPIVQLELLNVKDVQQDTLALQLLQLL